MKLTFFIALFALSIAGVEAIGPGDSMPYKADFQAPEFMSQYRCSVDHQFVAHILSPEQWASVSSLAALRALALAPPLARPNVSAL
jgi:hypothetical protein